MLKVFRFGLELGLPSAALRRRCLCDCCLAGLSIQVDCMPLRPKDLHAFTICSALILMWSLAASSSSSSAADARVVVVVAITSLGWC